jgi:hypothetical protein
MVRESSLPVSLPRPSVAKTGGDRTPAVPPLDPAGTRSVAYGFFRVSLNRAQRFLRD